jgi:hypothetical protein
MDYVASLVKGRREFDLGGNGVFKLGRGFMPPAVAESYSIADGTAGNAYGGGRRVGRKGSVMQYALPLHAEGGSNAGIERGLDELNSFLGEAGDEHEPVYFRFRPKSSMGGEPLLGSADASRQVKVLGGRVFKGDTYWQGRTREARVANCQALLTLDPILESAVDQYAGSAMGGVIEDWVGTVNGFSRGVIVAPAVDNRFPNPIFSHGTYDTGWSVTNAALLKTRVTEKRLRLFGAASVLLINTAATDHALVSWLTLTVATYTVSFYVRKADGSAVTSADCVVWNEVEVTSTFTHVGNGWYRVSGSFTGAASAKSIGIRVKARKMLYADGFQCELGDYATPLCHGDLFGHSWSGTQHNSTSSRAVGRLRYDEWVLKARDFTWWVAVKVNRSSAAIGSNVRLLYEETSNARLSVEASTGRVLWTDNVNTANGAATAFAAGDILIIHATLDDGGLKLYRNGAADGSGSAAFEVLSGATRLYIGSSDSPAEHCGFTFLGAGTRDRAMSAGEVAAHYADMAERARGGDGLGQRVDWLPYLHTEDGDGTLDNADDSTRENTGVIAGVAGNMPARTMFRLYTPNLSTSVWLGLHSDRLDDFQKMARRWYLEASGTADANASGGEYESMSAPTGTRPFVEIAVDTPDNVRGEFHYFLRAKRSAAAEAAAGYYLQYNGGYIWLEANKVLNPTTSYRWWYLGKLSFEPPARMMPENELNLNLGINIEDLNASGSFHFDYGMVINGKVAKLNLELTSRPGETKVASAYPNYLRVQGKQVILDVGVFLGYLQGDVIEVEPERYNLLTGALADDGGLHVLTAGITVSEVRITPRWALM